MNPRDGNLTALAQSAARFSESLEKWLRKYAAHYDQTASNRRTVRLRRGELQRLHRASRQPASVSLYGESQCGKSNLVSRFAAGIGAVEDAGGSLLVRDPVGTGRERWNVDGAKTIRFIRWLNHDRKEESTGLVCRFTTSAPESAAPGCFTAEVMSHADLVGSMALGFLEEIDDEWGEARKRKIAEQIAAVESAPLEDDPEGWMGDLLEAWRFLSETKESNARLAALGTGGWEAFVCRLLAEGKRPQFIARSRDCAFLRLASLLWDGQAEMTDAYRLLLVDLRKLQGATEISIPVTDVCAVEGPQPVVPLVSVTWIDELFNTNAAGSVRVHFRPGEGAESTAVGLSRATLVGLIRELVLPLEVVDGGRRDLDVLDFPGARAVGQASRFERHDNPADLALKVFRRGKLNRLFRSGVELHDSTILCLCVSGEGNLEAGNVVRDSLRSWLTRERLAAPGEDDGLTGGPAIGRREPPLVVAVTKSDRLLSPNGGLFAGRISSIKEKYCGEIPWMTEWHGGGYFRRIHWVHNPEQAVVNLPGAGPLRVAALPTEFTEGVRSGYRGQLAVTDHVHEAEARLDALLAVPPTDVRDLVNVILSLKAGERREDRLVDSMCRVLQELIATTGEWYVGPDDRNRRERARNQAKQDVAAVRRLLNPPLNPVSGLLRILELDAASIERVYRREARRVAETEGDGIGLLSFDDFYKGMVTHYARRLEAEFRRDARWLLRLAELPSGDGNARDSLMRHFQQIPLAAWFRDSIEKAAGPLVQHMNAAGVQLPVLSAFVGAVWNRNIVWLDRIPELDREPDRRPPPTLRDRKASSERILTHWDARLPAVYENLVDPSNAGRAGNGELGEMREGLRKALGTFKASLEGGSPSRIRIDALLRALGDAEVEDQAHREAGSA